MLGKLEDIAKNVQIQKRINKLKKQKPDETVSKGILDRMEKMFKNQGLSKEKIKEKLRKFCETKRNLDLKHLEKQ